MWRSADGGEWAIPAVFDGGRIHLTIPDSVVDRTVFPAVLDPTLGPEIAIDTPIYGVTPYSQTTPSVASNGTDYLVVWSDYRGSNVGTASDIYGARVSSAGALLDNAGIPICTSAQARLEEAIGDDHRGWMVVSRPQMFENLGLSSAIR